MDLKLIDRVVNAVLYEGYILYPYRPSAVKNQQRWNFGVLYPEPYSAAQNGTDAWSMQTECLIVEGRRARLDVRVRFLRLLEREVGKPVADYESQIANCDDSALQAALFDSHFQVVESLDVDGQVFHTWQEAVEREVAALDIDLDAALAQPQRLTFSFPSSQKMESLRDASGSVIGALIRKQQSIEGAVEVAARRVADQLVKITARILNLTPLVTIESRDAALMKSLVSTHTILGVQDGQFISLLDPPEEFREAAASCQNAGAWPVLVGSEAERNAMLSSPIILYDYPQVAQESAGDFFDGTEIDEMLVLRILTLTDEEKLEMRGADERARRMLERTETLPPEQMMKLHGAVRGLRQSKQGQQ